MAWPLGPAVRLVCGTVLRLLLYGTTVPFVKEIIWSIKPVQVNLAGELALGFPGTWPWEPVAPGRWFPIAFCAPRPPLWAGVVCNQIVVQGALVSVLEPDEPGPGRRVWSAQTRPGAAG